MISEIKIDMTDTSSLMNAIKDTSDELVSSHICSSKHLINILKIMFYAHTATILKQSAEEILATVIE